MHYVSRRRIEFHLARVAILLAISEDFVTPASFGQVQIKLSSS